MKYDVIVSDVLSENCYLINDEKGLIIVDPGCKYELIDNYIKSNNLKPLCILITHYHFDHITALNDLVSKYIINVYDYKSDNTDLFEILHTPGHTDDSVTFYFKKYNTMFTGDFLFKGSIGRCDFENSSVDDMKKSIEYIKTFDESITILPGHGEKSTLGYEFKNNYFLTRGL